MFGSRLLAGQITRFQRIKISKPRKKWKNPNLEKHTSDFRIHPIPSPSNFSPLSSLPSLPFLTPLHYLPPHLKSNPPPSYNPSLPRYLLFVRHTSGFLWIYFGRGCGGGAAFDMVESISSSNEKVRIKEKKNFPWALFHHTVCCFSKSERASERKYSFFSLSSLSFFKKSVRKDRSHSIYI